VSAADVSRSRALFGRAEVATLSLSLGIGVAALIAGWWGVSGTPHQTDQWRWLNLAVGGMILSGAGIAAWLFGATRRVTHSRQALLQAMSPPDGSDS
jgi:hypothetical protein